MHFFGWVKKFLLIFRSPYVGRVYHLYFIACNLFIFGFYYCNSYFSSSSRSHSTALSSGSSGGGPPPGYSETIDRNATLRSQDSGVLSGASSSASNFIIRDPKLRSKLEKCLLDRNRLTIGDLIKEGNFGAVYRGTLNNHGRREMVAVKTLKVLDDNVSFEEFMKEGVLTKGKIESF